MYGNNPYQSSYQSSYYPQSNMSYQPQQRYVPQPTTNITYVNGLEAVKATVLPPNHICMFLDSDNKFFYIKRTDLEGKATIEVHPYTDIDPNAAVEPKLDYVTVKEFNELKDEFKALKDTLTEVKQ